MKIIFAYLVMVSLVAVLPACGGGGGSSGSPPTGSSSSSGGSSSGGSGPSYLSWTNSANGPIVLDATGNRYQFVSTTGCMYLVNSNYGPINFCLTADSASSTGYANYGPTDCSNPGSNPQCNTASFDVVLTNNPAGGTSCIAVLGNGALNSVTVIPLSVTTGSTANNGAFDIQTTTQPTAFTVNWNGYIPICGGSNPYAGSYVFSSTDSGQIPQNLTIEVDTGGIINNNPSDITGTVTAAGTGSFKCNGCWEIYSITSAIKNANAQWVLSGTDNNGGTFQLTPP